MCLAMVYTDKAEPENLVLSNVQRIDCKDGLVYLTDLLDRQVVVEGEIVSVDLVGNTTIIRKTQKEYKKGAARKIITFVRLPASATGGRHAEL